jgi:histidinol-phosphate/aromatic aminotransferase/cobyric acid decarboxylase-like protein
MTRPQVFYPDDIDRNHKKYFKSLREDGQDIIDPSYWYANYSPVLEEENLSRFGRYRSDYGTSMASEKPQLVEAFSKWDEQNYQYDEITICSSATSASLIILAYLKNTYGTSHVYFETPCYFASLSQAEMLGYKVERLATHLEDGFLLNSTQIPHSGPKVLWLTQPRYGLGQHQEKRLLEEYLKTLGKNDFIVLDEAADNTYPTWLSDFNFSRDPRILKIRSPFKGVGINGPRISAILHASQYRKSIEIHLEKLQGSIDVNSLEFGLKVMGNEQLYRSLLENSNEQILKVNKKLHVQSLGSGLILSEMQSGYIGSVAVPYEDPSNRTYQKREGLLAFCAEHRMPVILGANLNFATNAAYEFIRLSYFNHEDVLRRAISILISFARRAL